MDFTELIDLVSERVGGQALAANDEFFAPKENLLKPGKPVFIEDKYTDRGKWMDGWETRRRRTPGYDWCILKLGLPGVLRGVIVDTSFFRGNFPESCSLEACVAAPDATAEELTSERARWVEVLPKSALQGDAQNRFEIASPYRFTHVRLNIFPDGGVARLRLYGEPVPDRREFQGEHEHDLAAAASGALVQDSSDMFFGSRNNLILPGPARTMGEGWETKRRRGPGHDWVVIRLAAAGTLCRAEVDTSHFKGNFPESCSLEGCVLAEAAAQLAAPLHLVAADWREILPRTKLQPDTRHIFEKELKPAGEITHVCFKIYPDGGVARLRLYGTLSREGKLALGLRWLNTLLPAAAEAELRSCCGSARWAQEMSRQRSFSGFSALLEAAEKIWWQLPADDWREAFAAHPRIGERIAKSAPAQSAKWSEQEQSAARGAAAGMLKELAEANRAYEERFGHIFIVCTAGKSADETLALLRSRLQNDAQTELRIAAQEQAKITRLRLEKLLSQ